MNTLIFSAGILALLTALVHIIAGQIEPVRPFLKSELPDIPKATLLGCWHMVSVMLVISAAAFCFIGWFNFVEFQNLVILLSASFVFFSVVFIVVGWYFFKARTFIKLPQWLLLLSIGLLGFMGVN